MGKTQTTGRFSEASARLRTGNRTLVVLADVSTSMAESAGTVSKHQMLTDVLTKELLEDATTFLAFNSRVTRASPDTLPSPRGSTALHLAFEAAEQFKPGVIFVISDGHPDDRSAALRAFMLQLAELGKLEHERRRRQKASLEERIQDATSPALGLIALFIYCAGRGILNGSS